MISRILGASLALGICSGLLHAEERAIIVAGPMGDPAMNQQNVELAKRAATALEKRGMNKAAIQILGDGSKVSKQQVTEALGQCKSLGESDRLWLVMIGHSAKSANGIAFQVTGPRLAATDLDTLLNEIPAQQTIAILTGGSGAFMTPLLKENREITTATRSEAQSDFPRFAEEWVAAFEKDPQATPMTLATTAAMAVEAACKRESLVQAEEARFGDGATGKVYAPPFPAELLAQAEASTPASQNEPSLPSAGEIEIGVKDTSSEWEKHPADADSLALLAAAKGLPNPGFPALILDQKLLFATAPDGTADVERAYQVYLSGAAGVEEWGTLMIPQAPPEVTTRLLMARLIFPDGSYSVFNPAKLPTGTVVGGCCPLLMKGAAVGCLVEFKYRTRRTLASAIPELSIDEVVQREIPAAHSLIEVQVPNKEKFRAVLTNSSVEPKSEVVNEMKKLRWELKDLPGVEFLPGDPPKERFVTSLAVSSLASWEAFEKWFRLLAKNADASDPLVVSTAKGLAEGAATREEKLRRVYDYVSKLRYIAIEIGVQGFRPRTPKETLENQYGDCKDKANLMVALLREMGIEARFALINRGSFTDVEFPSWQFNHAICYVPGEGLWLDATDGIAPFGFIAPGNAGRSAFVFGSEKAEFITVNAPDTMSTVVADQWELDFQTGKGKFTRTLGGLKEYQLRAQMKALGPKRRDLAVRELITRLLPSSEPAKTTVSGVDVLSDKLKIEAEFALGGEQLPLLDDGLGELFLQPTRDRVLVLNESQPFRYEQTVKVAGKTLPSAGLFQSNGNFKFEITVDKDVRRSSVQSSGIEISPENYAKSRATYQDWKKSTNL